MPQTEIVSGVALIAGGYVLGSMPFGLWLTKAFKGIDVREVGSGNIGFTNVFRAAGAGVGSVVFVLDMAKGFAPAFAASYLAPDSPADLWPLLAGAASIAGHNWSLFLGFKGGRGVCTTCGVLFGVTPAAAGVTLAVWALVIAATRYVSVASIVATLLYSTIAFVRHDSIPIMVFCAIAGPAILIRHIPNMKRLARGEENKFGRIPDTPAEETGEAPAGGDPVEETADE